MEQMKKKWNSPEFQKQLHDRMLEHQNKKNESEANNFGKQQIKTPKLGIRVYTIGDKVYRPKERPKLVCNLKANTKK